MPFSFGFDKVCAADLLRQHLLTLGFRHETRMYIRSLTANAAECEFDSQGRIQLPSNLVRQAEIAKQCVIIGAADHGDQDRQDPGLGPISGL